MTRWVRFATREGRVALGTLDGQRIAEHRGDPFDGAAPTGASWWLEEVRLLAPCVPGKIVALWNNFHALAQKLGKAEPDHPLFLIKPASSLAGPGDAIERPRGYTGRIAFEGELGIVVGRRCSNADLATADACIFGYTCVNDVTAADVLNADPTFPQWCRAKGFDTFGCIGPAIATDLDWRSARVVTTLDGVERQSYPLADMIFGPGELVSRLSHDMTLLPGDVIACGTSLGVGSMKANSTVTVAVEGIGDLANTLRG